MRIRWSERQVENLPAVAPAWGGPLPRTSLRFQRLCSNVTPRALHHVVSYAGPPHQAPFIMFVPPGERPRGRLFTRASEQSRLGGPPSLMKGCGCCFSNEFHLGCVATGAPWVRFQNQSNNKSCLPGQRGTPSCLLP